MVEPADWMHAYYRTLRSLLGPLGHWPLTDGEKGDAEREELERLSWQRLYDVEIKPRLGWIGRQ